MSSKSPYEIRFDVLSMAKDVSVEHYYANREKLIATWDREAENARLTGSPVPPLPQLPEFPTEQVIVKKAQFLSEYIDSNGKGKSTPEFLQD